jgi:hypothetical protein
MDIILIFDYIIFYLTIPLDLAIWNFAVFQYIK